jgi:asparagine synthase (glutamine-hydrolysing)
MPGIAGIVSREPPAACRRRLAAMVHSMLHEPCYQSATCEAPEIGVYAGWVAHPGSFAAMESGRSASGSIDLVFAGECYQECSGQCPAPGGPDRRGESRGSLLGLYDRLGEDWVVELNGLFSGLLIDRRRARALLFNDRYGVERVYVHENEHGTYFASEAKALLCVLPATRSFDDEGVAQFLTFGCPLDGRTFFRGIRMLEGGSIWTFEGDSCRKRQYFASVEWERQAALSVEDFQSEFEWSFKRALPRYLRSDSRIGISLTGGLDTRMIMACLQDLPKPPICYTFLGLRGETLDARVAARVAAECGLEHRLLRISPDFVSDYPSYLDRTVYVTDGSAGPVWTHEIYLNAQARQLASVRLTGNFGSEVLRGVSTFKKVGLSRELIAPHFRMQVDAVAGDMPSGRNTPVSFAAFHEIPWNLFGIVASAKSQLTFRSPYLDNDLVALAHRAPSSVRQSSASASRLVGNAHPRLSRIPTDRGVVADGSGVGYMVKRLFAELTFKLDYMHKEAPPQGLMRFLEALAALDKVQLLGLHKWLPYRLWFRHELAEYVTEALTDATMLRLPFWNERVLPRMARDHVNGRKNYVREINAVLTLATVDRLLVRGNGLGASASTWAPQ